jgi:hypothetical protein
LFSASASGSLRAGAGEAPPSIQGKSMRSKLAAAVLAALLCAPALADEVPADKRREVQFLRSLNYRTGDVALADAGATLHVQPASATSATTTRARCSSSTGATRRRQRARHAGARHAAPGADHSWAWWCTYSDEGHVSDEDATKVDYAR